MFLTQKIANSEIKGLTWWRSSQSSDPWSQTAVDSETVPLFPGPTWLSTDSLEIANSSPINNQWPKDSLRIVIEPHLIPRPSKYFKSMFLFVWFLTLVPPGGKCALNQPCPLLRCQQHELFQCALVHLPPHIFQLATACMSNCWWLRW